VATIQSNDPTSKSGLSASMRSVQTNQSLEVKNSIQSRIDEQRNLINARKQAMAAESKKARAQNGMAHTIGANTNDTGVESVGLESGVFSASPSELDAVKNRKQAPLPTTSARASPSATQNQLGQYKGHHAAPPQPSQSNSRQHQISYEGKNRNQASLPKTSASASPSATQDQLGQYIGHHAGPPQPNQSNTPSRHRQVASSPQQPPTYEEITRDILGAYSTREPRTVPDNGGTTNRTESLDTTERTDLSHLVIRSDAGSIVSRDSTYVSKATFVPAKLNHVTKPLHRSAQANVAGGGAYSTREPRTVPDNGGTTNCTESLDTTERTDSSHLVIRSDAGSIVSRDSTYVSRATFVPAKLNHVTKPSHRPSQANVAKGANKWGFY
jgi:hypothetical protein